MTSSSPEHRRWQFEMLIMMEEENDTEGCKELFSRLLSEKHDVIIPLMDYIAERQDVPQIAILVKLLGKMGENAAAPLLIGLLKSKRTELRLQTIIALGWLRTRAALEQLDEIEARDSDEEVRREAGIAIEEILRDFPTLRDQLKFHQKIAIKRNPITIDSKEVIGRTTPPGGEERRRLVGMMPRMLAMKNKAVPLGIGKGGVVGIAVDATTETDPTDYFAKLLGRSVELHGWPLQAIYERILSFYRWGDNDWVIFGEFMTDHARTEVMRLVTQGISPLEPHPPLPDCVDASEAVQSFLSICTQKPIRSAIIEFDEAGDLFVLTLVEKNGEKITLDAPPSILTARFMKGIELIANCQECISADGEADSSVKEGLIRLEPPTVQAPTIAAVRSQLMGGLHVIGVEFKDYEKN
ncbi:MAG: HEAT repeat domain-containing protein [Sumerlaeia bacterium]